MRLTVVGLILYADRLRTRMIIAMGEVSNISEKVTKEIKEALLDADKVVIGIGMDWMAGVETGDIMEDAHIDLSERERYIQLYSKLKNTLSDKDYYIITLCYDDLIFEVLDEERVVAPCGSFRLLQCGNHVMTKDEVKLMDGKPVCPLCGGSLSYNNIDNAEYMEEGYMARFNEYKMWLQSTINKKLAILELGADMKYPGVIRFAFDRLCQYNLKSTFYRVNQDLYHHNAESGSRGKSIKGDSRELIAML